VRRRIVLLAKQRQALHYVYVKQRWDTADSPAGLSSDLRHSTIGDLWAAPPDDRLADVLGNPSARDDFAEYEIHWYLGEVQEEDVGSYACASAYELKEDGVVEIWLHVWSPDPHG